MERKKLYIIIAVSLVVVVLMGFYLYFQVRKRQPEKAFNVGKTLEELLRTDLTAPATGSSGVAKEILNNLSAVGKKIPVVSEDIIKSLTAPK
jgi:hypothetical protein